MKPCALLSIFMVMSAMLPGDSVARAQQAPASLAVVAGSWDGAEVAIPFGRSARVRVEGRDAAGKKLPIDASKVTWETRSKNFSYVIDRDVITVTPLIDAFDVVPPKNPEYDPGTMIRARYGSVSVTFKVSGVLDLQGKWLLTVTGDKIDLNLKQRGRDVQDDKGRKGRLVGKVLTLHVTHYLGGIPIPLEPIVTFTSRTSGTGYADAPLIGKVPFTFVRRP